MLRFQGVYGYNCFSDLDVMVDRNDLQSGEGYLSGGFWADKKFNIMLLMVKQKRFPNLSRAQGDPKI